GFMRDPPGWRSRRHALWFLFFKEAFALHPIRAALKRQHAILYVWRELMEDCIVILNQVQLSIAFLRPEDLAGMRYSYRQFRGHRLGAPGPVHAGTSGNSTSWGRLSSLRHRKTGWQRLLSAVHSWNDSWAMSRGARKTTPFSRGVSNSAVCDLTKGILFFNYGSPVRLIFAVTLPS